MDRLSYARRWFPLMSPDSDGGGSGETGATVASGATGPSGQNSPPIAPEVQALIDSAAAAARKAGETSGKKAAEEAIAKAQTEATAKAEQDRKVAAGEFDAVRADLETKFTAVSGENETLKSQVAAYKSALGPVIADRLTELETADAETAKVFPKDADPLAQLDWLTSPLVRRVVDLAGQTNGAARPSGGWVTPRPANTSGAPSIDQTRKELAALRGIRLR